MSRFYEYIKESYKYPDYLQRIDAGGAYGHLRQPHEINYTFGEFKELINDVFSGNLEYVREKTDGQQLSFTWKDGQILFARNKSHIKNYAENAMTTGDLANKFSGRGSLLEAFEQAANDLTNAIDKLSDKQVSNIFKNGKKFMSCEIMYVENENLISYGANEIRFHGTKEYDVNGKEINSNKQDSKILADMLKKVKADKQNTYQIKDLKSIELPRNSDFSKQKNKVINLLNKLMKKYKLSDGDSLSDYKLEWFRELANKKNIKYNERLLERWANGDKSYNLNQIKSDFSGENLDKIKEIEKNIDNYMKECMLPVERVIMTMGTILLSNITDLMTINPDVSVQKVRKELENSIKELRSKGTEDILSKLEMEMRRLEAAGGMDSIVPTEGITFIWKGEFLKLTGGFSPQDKIINMVQKLK